MKKRSVVAVIFLPIITLGIYSIYWFVKTKGELNAKGAQIPTAWLIIIPLVNIWWMWKYFEGADHVTGGKANGILMFVIAFFVTSLISMALCQDAYNKLGGAEMSSVPEENAPATPASVTSQTATTTEAPATPPTQPTIPTV